MNDERDQLRAALAGPELPATAVEAQLARFRRRATPLSWRRVAVHVSAAAAIAIAATLPMTAPKAQLESGRILGALDGGREIRVEEDAVVRFDRARVRFESGSRLKVEGPRAIRMDAGDADVATAASFEITTPAGRIRAGQGDFTIHLSREDVMNPSAVALLVLVNSGSVTVDSPAGSAVASAGAAVRANAREVRALSPSDELKRIEVELRGREQALETLRRENDAAVVEAARRQQDHKEKALEELEKRFDELAKDLDPEMQMTAKMFLFKKKAARNFIAMQARSEVRQALAIKVDDNPMPAALAAEGVYEKLEARVMKEVAAIQGLEVDTIDYDKLASLREATDEQALRELRNTVLARQREASRAMYAGLETDFGPGVREFVDRQLQADLGWHALFHYGVFGGKPASCDWWTPLTKVLESTDLHPFGQVSRVLTPTELAGLDRELRAAIEQEPGEKRAALLTKLQRTLGSLRYRTKVSMQMISIARKLDR